MFTESYILIKLYLIAYNVYTKIKGTIKFISPNNKWMLSSSKVIEVIITINKNACNILFLTHPLSLTLVSA
jgi:hypothetical protein